MRSSFQLFALPLMLLVPLVLSGCKKSPSTADGHGDEAHEDEHEHEGEHHHDHDHKDGPHGGHILELTGGDKDYHAEWLHDDEKGTVTVFLLDEDQKTSLENSPPEVSIEIRTGNSPKTYALPSTETVNDVPVLAAYSITDPELVTALEIVVEGNEPLLHVNIGEKPMTAKFEKHDHEH
jgi:hypothetical protein